MKYLCLGYHDARIWEALPERERAQLIEDSLAYERVLKSGGHVIDSRALQGVTTAATLRFRKGEMSVTDGPFAETKEQLGGVMVLEANDLNHAIQLMSKIPCMREGGALEIRPINEEITSSRLDGIWNICSYTSIMLETPQIIDTPAQQSAVIRLTIPREEIQRVMGPAIGELMAAIGAQGLAPLGPIFSHHFRMDPKTFDFEVGVPVATPVSPAGRVQPGQLPAAKVARTVYRGPYEGLGAAWGEFQAWIAVNGHKPAQDLWERYVKGPESGPDPATWCTELNRPLID